MTQEEVMGLFRKSSALLDGHFELRSGLHSNRYFQCANVLRFPRIAGRLCEALVTKARNEHPDVLRADAVISPAMGGILVGHEVARVLDLPSIFAEKQEGRLVLRRFKIEPGRRYVVAEDVVTRGGRVQETIDLVEEAGGIATAVLVMVDRSSGQAAFRIPLFSLAGVSAETYDPAACPLCSQGLPLTHPGS